jgi:formylglycine-generating enzyme required for sulfatase activity
MTSGPSPTILASEVMERSSIAAVVVLGVLTGVVLLGCCPIPVPRTVLQCPAGTVEVQDRRMRPIPEAQVVVARYRSGPPPQVIYERFSRVTDATGRARFERQTVRENSFPLMMHGVNFYDFLVCVEHPGHRPRLVRWPKEPGQEPAASVSAVLDPPGAEPGPPHTCGELVVGGRLPRWLEDRPPSPPTAAAARAW